MPNRRRLAIMATLTLTVAACSGGPTPSASPQAAAASIAPTGNPPPAQPTADPAFTFFPRASLPAESTCPELGSGNSANPFNDATFDVGHFGVDVQVSSVAPLSDPAASMHPEHRPVTPSVGQLIGGHEARFHLGYYYEGKTGPTMIQSAAVALRFENGTSQPLPTRIEPYNEHTNQVVVAIPDVAASGTLELTVDWMDGCFHFSGGGETGFSIVPTSVTAPCSMVESQHRRDLDELFEPALHVGDGEVDLFPPYSSARYLPYDNPGIDFFAVYSWDPKAAPIIAAAGSSLRVAGASPGLTLLSITAVGWTRSSVVEAVKDYPPQGLRQVLHQESEPRADGSFRLRAPDAPGRYVVSVAHGYEWPCGTGTAYAVFSLTVE